MSAEPKDQIGMQFVDEIENAVIAGFRGLDRLAHRFRTDFFALVGHDLPSGGRVPLLYRRNHRRRSEPSGATEGGISAFESTKVAVRGSQPRLGG
jgi:hypothetical protein